METKFKKFSLLTVKAMAMVFCLNSFCSLQAQASEIYVSPQGDDHNSGESTKPLATLAAARDAARKIKTGQPSAVSAIKICLAPGTYALQQTLDLTQEDSGTEKAPLIIESTKLGLARLLGGVQIPKFEAVTEPKVLDRLPAEAKGHVVMANLKALGISDFGAFKSRGFGRPESPSHMELFFDGQPMTPARWPNEGAWDRIAGFPEDTAQNDDHGGKIGKLDNGFFLCR